VERRPCLSIGAGIWHTKGDTRKPSRPVRLQSSRSRKNQILWYLRRSLELEWMADEKDLQFIAGGVSDTSTALISVNP
jgi:hypothetical protein